MSPTRKTPSRDRGGFTLSEVMIGATLGTIVLGAVLSAFLMLGRSGYNAANYSVMEAESRRALDMFSADARMANNITWNNSSSITLRVVTSGSAQLVTYTYSATTKNFTRKLGNAASTNPELILIRGVADFSFRRYKVVNGVDYTAANDLETKQIQITLRAVRKGVTTVDATNAVLSARIVLRNKAVST